MKWSVFGLLVLGLVAAGSAALLVMSLSARPTSVEGSPGTTPDEVQQKIVVAALDLAVNTRVRPEHLVEASVAVSEVPEEAVRSSVGIIGQVLVVPRITGQPITKNCVRAPFWEESLPPGCVGYGLSLTVEHAGPVYPSAMVDVLLIRSSHAREAHQDSEVVLEQVPTLAVDGRTVLDDTSEDGETLSRQRPDGRRLVVLHVTFEQARLLYEAENSGKIRLVVRNPLDRTAATQFDKCDEWSVAQCKGGLCESVGGRICPKETDSETLPPVQTASHKSDIQSDPASGESEKTASIGDAAR